MARALAQGEWPWPATLRADEAFIDGLCALAQAWEQAGGGEIALAATVADDNAEQSALARTTLIWFRAGRAPQLAAPPPDATIAVPIACATLLEAFDAAARRGVRAVALPRWCAVTLASSAPPGLRLVAYADIDDPAATASIEFATQGESRSATDARLEIRVLQAAHSAVAAWFAATSAEEPVWHWPLPESPRPLVAPAMTFSASRLNGFVKCPRRWFFEYLCDALEDEGSAAATYGKVFHEALEALHRVMRMPADFSGNAMLERLFAELDLAFERNRPEFASALEFEVSRLRARAVAVHYARWLRAEADDHPMEVEAVEVLQRWSLGGHEFVGYIDRIDRPTEGGAVSIYDYKTGRIDDDPRAYVEKMRRGEEAQLALYHVVRRMRGDRIGRLALVSLRDPRDRVWLLALDMVDAEGNAEVERAVRSGVIRGTCTQADIDAAIASLVARADLLTRTGVEHFEAGSDPPCAYCTYARACRDRPADGERVFAR